MFDIIVIGGGPAGVVAALRARELGANVALVERGKLGGVCMNDGCMPTRVLAKAARLVRDAEQLADYGIRSIQPAVDFRQLLAVTDTIIAGAHNHKQLATNLHAMGITTITEAGAARFIDAQRIELADGRILAAERFIICTGGQARRPSIPGFEHALTFNDIWRLEQLPERVLVVGGSATGCQLASVLAAFGAQVTLIERAPRLLARCDRLIAAELEAAFHERGIVVVCGVDGVEQIERQGDELYCRYRQAGAVHTLATAAVIFAVGWPGNIEALNLAAAGVESENGYIVVDDQLRTSEPHIYAAGDITGRIMLAQSADHQGRVAAENAMLGADRTFTNRIIPSGGFTDPEYASVGITEEEAQAGHDYATAAVPYADLDRAVIDGRTRGQFKLIVDRQTRRILGAHVVGEQAVEVVQLVATAMLAGMRVEQLATLKLAYPTYTAIVGLAARRLVRELGVVPLAPHWRDLHGDYVADWERSTIVGVAGE